MLDNALPAGCEKLRRAMTGDGTETVSPEDQQADNSTRASDGQSAAPPQVKTNKRQNIWDEMPMDFQKLKIENERREE